MPPRKHMERELQLEQFCDSELDLLETGARMGEWISLPQARGEGGNIFSLLSLGGLESALWLLKPGSQAGEFPISFWENHLISL